MVDGTTRFIDEESGESIFHYMGTSSFSQYTVLNEISVICIENQKVLQEEKNIDKRILCLFSCGLSTGYGSVMNIAKPKPNTSIGIFGLGVVGLGAVIAANESKCSNIICIDKNTSKFSLAYTLGATDCIESYEDREAMLKKIFEYIPNGLDFSIEAIGNTNVMRTAFESTRRGWGLCVIAGVAPSGETLQTTPFHLITGRTQKGCAFGGYKSKTHIPKLVKNFIDNNLSDKLNIFLSKSLSLSDIREAFELGCTGTLLRVSITL